MAFLTAHHTDVGIKKNTNQDALLLKTAKTPKGSVALFIVCDGMGGLSHGELASATVIRGMAEWFDVEMPRLSQSEYIGEEIYAELTKCINQLNEKILHYGETSKVKLGTTLTALLIFHNKYFIAHIGDSRAYSISNSLHQLTQDQTLVGREVARGNITEEQAKVDPRRNVLLQCVGATKEIEVGFSTGDVQLNTVFMLCSDGFYHQITEEELALNLSPETIKSDQQLKDKIVELVELVKARKEVDNISVVAAKVL
ncbi:protein phosphatase 2C domain-containing protein [Neobacillus niacini]|uniref:PP2C family protein-serine/threonine phosphatase n=1 Tax=Neobacillus niacini TaxID=86668 RepID=UPI00052FD2A4|nr:protein phosphatase 2C domain-containing protein [Neobacillus niacini]KGM45418.1 serine/threonine protein phosphatase [Neobacillus niacini]MEC1525750.1 protein phosphatase 2C domain-containing protein [Neobacillus niacini]